MTKKEETVYLNREIALHQGILSASQEAPLIRVREIINVAPELFESFTFGYEGGRAERLENWEEIYDNDK